MKQNFAKEKVHRSIKRELSFQKIDITNNALAMAMSF